MRRKREGHLGIRLFEANPFSGQLVYRRRLNPSIPVTGDVVGAHRVKCSQYHRRRTRLSGLGKAGIGVQRKPTAGTADPDGRCQKAQQVSPTLMRADELYHAKGYSSSARNFLDAL